MARPPRVEGEEARGKIRARQATAPDGTGKRQTWTIGNVACGSFGWQTVPAIGRYTPTLRHGCCFVKVLLEADEEVADLGDVAEDGDGVR